MGKTGSELLLFLLGEWKLLLILSLLFALYIYLTSTFDHFEKKGIAYKKPTIFLGNIGPRIFAKQSFHEFHLDVYKYFKGRPYGGLFEGRRPVLYLMDLDIIKAVTIRDFDYFVDRLSLNSNEPAYLKRSLLNLKGQDWKHVRSTITPTFSSLRLKNMLPLIQLCSNQLGQYLKQFDKTEIEMKATMGHFTLEVIGACAFGIKCDALSDENTHFIKVAEKFNYMSKSKRLFFFFIIMCAPFLLKHLNFSFLNPETCEELMRILKTAKKDRRNANVTNHKGDFLQLLIDAAESEKEEGKTREFVYNDLDDDTIDAQALLFLIAGYETSSTLLSFAIHVLATKPELQTKLRSHVEEITRGKEIDYDVLSQLTYLDGFLLETLRMYPPVARVDRVCTRKYVLPGTSVEINVGDVVVIPVYGIHMDPEVYPDPHEFRPERFVGEEKNKRPSHHFLAFGAGPRNCIGLRFAMYSAKQAMVELLKNFKFSASERTVEPVKFNKREMLLKAESGLWVRLESLQ